MEKTLLLQIISVSLGLLYLWLEYKANIWLWAVSIVMPVNSCILYFSKGLYADAGMDVYYMLAAVYGFWMWKFRPGAGKKERPITHTPVTYVLPLVGVYGVAHVALYFLLSRCTDSTVPFWDAMSTALSIVAMWMLSRKYVEEWLVWIAVDTITVSLHLYKGIPLTAGLHFLYIVLAVAGYLRWKRMARLQAVSA